MESSLLDWLQMLCFSMHSDWVLVFLDLHHHLLLLRMHHLFRDRWAQSTLLSVQKPLLTRREGLTHLVWPRELHIRDSCHLDWITG